MKNSLSSILKVSSIVSLLLVGLTTSAGAKDTSQELPVVSSCDAKTNTVCNRYVEWWIYNQESCPAGTEELRTDNVCFARESIKKGDRIKYQEFKKPMTDASCRAQGFSLSQKRLVCRKIIELNKKEDDELTANEAQRGVRAANVFRDKAGRLRSFEAISLDKSCRKYDGPPSEAVLESLNQSENDGSHTDGVSACFASRYLTSVESDADHDGPAPVPPNPDPAKPVYELIDIIASAPGEPGVVIRTDRICKANCPAAMADNAVKPAYPQQAPAASPNAPILIYTTSPAQ